MRGTDDLKIIFSPFSQLFISEICQAMGAPVCICKKRRIACPYCHNAPKKEETKDIQSIALNGNAFDVSKSLAMHPSQKY